MPVRAHPLSRRTLSSTQPSLLYFIFPYFFLFANTFDRYDTIFKMFTILQGGFMALSWFTSLIHLGISVVFLFLFYRLVAAIEKIANK